MTTHELKNRTIDNYFALALPSAQTTAQQLEPDHKQTLFPSLA